MSIFVAADAYAFCKKSVKKFATLNVQNDGGGGGGKGSMVLLGFPYTFKM